MLDEALRLEDVYLSTSELSGTPFSVPRAVNYFENIKASQNNEDRPLIAGANLTLKLGETICIGGPSGKGKSAILRLIAGLARPLKGHIYYFGEYIPAERLTALEVAKRQVGYVLQNAALISNLRVIDNIALPLRYHRVGTEAEIQKKVNMAMDLMRVRNFATMFPHLSLIHI